MIERYKVIDGSQSAHCCFVATVVDTTKHVLIGGKPYMARGGLPQYEAVCECFEDADATMICAALNATVA